MNKLLLFLFLPSLSFAQVDSTDIIVKQMMENKKSLAFAGCNKKWTACCKQRLWTGQCRTKCTVTSETVIRLGSVSKQFFATAIMKLMEEGKLSIEDPVHKFFPDAPEAWRPIKIKNLMSHTSGLQREAPAYDNFKIQPDIDVIRSAYNLPLDFKTGDKIPVL
jgi:hypothetical protein